MTGERRVRRPRVAILFTGGTISMVVDPGAGGNVPTLDGAAKAATTATFRAACGGVSADLVVADIADRDAGWRASRGQDTWIHDGATLPEVAPGSPNAAMNCVEMRWNFV